MTLGDASSSAPAAPRNAAEAAGLQARADALRSALRGAQQRCADLTRELRGADPYARAVLEQQMTTLDDRVVQLQTDIASTQGLLAGGASAVASTAQPPRGFVVVGPNGPSVNVVPVLLLIVVVLQVIASFRARLRRPGSAASDALVRDAAARLARVEQAVDAIAIEVERVSEGQRFVTRALGEVGAHAPRHATAPRREHATPV